MKNVIVQGISYGQFTTPDKCDHPVYVGGTLYSVCAKCSQGSIVGAGLSGVRVTNFGRKYHPKNC